MQCINSNLLRYANHSLITTPSTNKNNKVSPDANGDVKMPFILGKMKKKKELLNQIIKEAEEYIQAFYEKRKVNCEASKATNKETEKIYLANQAKFHKEADKHYWKGIAELIPSVT
ncbi:hypothetical protein S83_007578 [Arachis hypogaea]|nr:Clathrin light chain [Arachis hypogaea]